MASQKVLIDEPDRIIVIHMMPEMLVTDVFEGAVGSTADPVQKTPKMRIRIVVPEHGIVAAFVDHISADGHRMPQQKCGTCIDPQIAAEQAVQAQYVTTHAVQERRPVKEHAPGFVKYFAQCVHRASINRPFYSCKLKSERVTGTDDHS